MHRNCVYIQTPFHLRVFLKLKEQIILFNYDWIIFYDRLMGEQIADNITGNNYILQEINGIEMDTNLSIQDQLKNCKKVKKRINYFKQEIDQIINTYDILNFVFFSEKNIFSQLVLSRIKIHTTAWSIDEGTGHYVLPSNNDLIKKTLYKIITPFLVGFKYEYFRVLGTHKRIDNLVLRVPELQKFSRSQFSVKSFKEMGLMEAPGKLIFSDNTRPWIMILTSPYSEEGRADLKQEIQFIEGMVKLFTGLGFGILFKPHPREDFEMKIQNIKGMSNVKIVPASIAFENIFYHDFIYIINFYSSIIIDLLSSNFSRAKIITVNLTNRRDANHLFSKTPYFTNFEDFQSYVKEH
jgi:hypothetical protein